MSNYKYLIVGGGMTADAAVHGIRQADPDGAIGLISTEVHPPYNRPPLSKGLWKGRRLETIWRHVANHEAIQHLGRTALGLDVQAKTVTDDRGTVYHYQKLLLATGGTPRRLAIDHAGIIYFRTLDDYHQLRSLCENGTCFAVIGAGFIGSEIAAALALNGKRVVMIFPEEGVGGRIFPRELSLFLNAYYQQRGVEILAGDAVAELGSLEGQFTLKTLGGRTVQADGVVAGIGIEPNVLLALRGGLRVDGGIVVDESLRTSAPDVFAAGDVACFYNPSIEQFLRCEHEDNANTMGYHAGLAMAGEPTSYDHLPFFYSDLFDLGYEAVGQLDSGMETVAEWKQPMQEGIVYYLRGGRVRGVLLWNVWEHVAAARELITSHEQFLPQDLKQRLPV